MGVLFLLLLKWRLAATIALQCQTALTYLLTYQVTFLFINSLIYLLLYLLTYLLTYLVTKSEPKPLNVLRSFEASPAVAF